MFKLLTAFTFLILVIGNEKIAVPIVLLLVVNLDGVGGFGYFGHVYVFTIILSLLFLTITTFYTKPFKCHKQVLLIALFVLLLPVIYFAILNFKYYLNVWIIASHLFFAMSCFLTLKTQFRKWYS